MWKTFQRFFHPIIGAIRQVVADVIDGKDEIQEKSKWITYAGNPVTWDNMSWSVILLLAHSSCIFHWVGSKSLTFVLQVRDDRPRGSGTTFFPVAKSSMSTPKARLMKAFEQEPIPKRVYDR